MGQKQFSQNMDLWLKKYTRSIYRKVDLVHNKKSIDDKMKAKVRLIKFIIKDLPIGPATCVYCNTAKDCKSCSYGKTHDCSAIQDGQRKFLAWVDKYYK